MTVLYEDNHILAAIKPAGTLSQADGSDAPDMLTELKAYIKERDRKPGNVFMGLVHRLDRNVGGTMVFAKTSKGASRLSAELRGKRFYKAYAAVVSGQPEADDMLLENDLVKDEKQNLVREDAAEGRRSLLRVIRLAGNADGDKSLLLCMPITGRAHQIRVQLALAGLPILGDAKYGAGPAPSGKPEDMGLWSCHIIVKHPVRDEEMHFTSLPERRGVWKAFTEEELRRAEDILPERIKEWFTI